MIELIGGLLLILIGIAIVFLKKSPKISTNVSTESTNDKDKKDADKDKTALQFASSIPLEDLEAPANFPEEIVFYFGSQTGTAEKFCTILDKEITSVKGARSARVIDFEDFNPDTFKSHSLVVICAATHYEGDPCDNTKKFFKWIRE